MAKFSLLTKRSVWMIAFSSRGLRVAGRACLVVGLVVFGGAAQVAEATEPVGIGIVTRSGKLLTGRLDSKTDDTWLWVRRESEQMVLTSSVAWDDVVEVRLDGKPIEIAALKAQREQLASELPFGFLAQTAPAIHWAPPFQNKPLRITNIEIEAAVVNLDRDVEPDGIELVVAVVDVHGRPVPVRGTLSVRLLGEHRDHHTGRVQIKNLQRWSQQVSPDDFVDGVARYTLPFRTVRPEFDLDLGPHALVNARLGAFGHGNYEASVGLPLRQWNPFRDRLQLIEGSRFARDELTGNIRRGVVIHGRRQRYVGPW